MDELPQASVANQVRMIVFSSGHEPPTIMSEEVIIYVEQLSDAVAVPVLAGNVLSVQAMVMFAGQVMRGGALSSTVMV